MLQSEVLFFNVVAALTLAIHACRDFPRTRPLLDGLFEELDGSGRMWELLGFAVLLPDTPRDRVGLLACTVVPTLFIVAALGLRFSEATMRLAVWGSWYVWFSSLVPIILLR